MKQSIYDQVMTEGAKIAKYKRKNIAIQVFLLFTLWFSAGSVGLVLGLIYNLF